MAIGLEGEQLVRKLVERADILERESLGDRHEDVNRMVLGEPHGLANEGEAQRPAGKIVADRPVGGVQEHP